MSSNLIQARRIFVALALALPIAAGAADAKKKPAGNKVDLNLPTFGAIPKGDGIEKPKAEKVGDSPSVTPSSASYTVVRVSHGKGFIRGAGGATPTGGGLSSIPASGNPLTTEKFTTVVRVKSPQRVNAPIELMILDPRGDTALSASGEVNFRGVKQDEVDYTVDWDPTPVRSAGQFQVMVRIAGQVMGTFPVKVEEPASRK